MVSKLGFPPMRQGIKLGLDAMAGSGLLGAPQLGGVSSKSDQTQGE